MRDRKPISRLAMAWGMDRTGWVLCGAALVLYALAGHWGLPQATTEVGIRGWDVDGVGGMNTLSELHNLLVDPKPDWYTAYPLLHYLILTLTYLPYFALLRVTGGMATPSGEYPFGFEDPVASLWMLGLLTRVVTLVMAAGTVAALYVATRRMFDRRTAVVATAAFALAAPMVYYARTGNLDVPVLFWTALGIAVAVRAVQEELTIRRALLLGSLAALAVATKDQVYGAWVPGLLYVCWVHAMRVRAAGPSSREAARPPAWQPVAALVLMGAVVFVLASGIPFFPERFIRHLRFITGFEGTFYNVQNPTWITQVRDATPAGYLALAGDVTLATLNAVGPLLLLLGIAGIVVARRRTRAATLLAWMVVGFLVLTIVPIRHMQYRYALFPAFILAPFASHVLVEALRGGRRLRLASAFGLAGMFLYLLAGAADLTWQMVRDARYAAADWLREELPDSASLGWFGIRHQLPHLPAGTRGRQLEAAEWLAKDAPRGDPAWLVVAPDFFSDTARVRSEFLPDSIYRRLLDGSLGYERVGFFRTPPLTGRPLPYLPYVNPQVQIFVYTGGEAGGRSGAGYSTGSYGGNAGALNGPVSR